MKLLGVDVCKLLWFYRPDSKVAEHQREVVRSLVRECAEFSLPLDAGVDVPWMLLSAGVGYEAFKTQVEIACRAGGSGFMAGRSFWRDAASTYDPKQRAPAAKDAADRLSELAAVTRRHGRPFAPKLEGKDFIIGVPRRANRPLATAIRTRRSARRRPR